MPEINTLQVQAISPSLMIARPAFNVATSLRLATLQQAMVVVAGGGPDFPAAQEPLQDGVAYAASDGTSYYRPILRVAAREPGRRPGPDVWFLEDGDGVITLQWTLDVVPMAAGTKPLPMTIDSVKMVWDSGSRDFEAPGVEPVENPAEGQSALRIHGGARLRPDEAATLEAAMNHHESACRLEVTYSYSYTVQVAAPVGSPAPEPSGPAAHVRRIDLSGVRMHRMALGAESATARVLLQPDLAVHFEEAAAAAPAAPAFTLATRINPELRAQLLDRKIFDMLTPDTRPEARRQSVVRTVPFVFEPSDEANGPIYRSLHDAANLTDDWAQLGDAGWLRDSGFPNTIFRLPDALRLAWDAETAGPRMAPTLYRDADGNPRVRLLLRLAPWQDPSKVVLTRTGVDMPAARVVVGPVDSSTLHMGGAFPEELSLVGGAGVAIPLATGAELAFDVSLSFYEFVCQVVARPEGLSGTVDVVVGAKPVVEGSPTPGGPVTVPVPVTIRLDRVDDLPCTLSVPEGVASPTTVSVKNASGADLSIGGCAVTFLQVDPESVTPVDTYPAKCTTAFPVVVPAGGSVDLTLALEEQSDEVIWNGVLVELLDKRLTSSPADVLRRLHELAAPGDLSRDLTFSSPVFAAATLPAKWSSLANIEVEVTAGGRAPAVVVIGPGNASRKLPVPTTLTDLIAGGPGGITTVSYRVRNNYTDHQGAWSKPQEQSGQEIIVYPNPAEGD